MLLANLFGLILLLGIFVITIDTSNCNKKHGKCDCHCCPKSETEKSTSKMPKQNPTLSGKITTTTTKKSPNTMSKPQTTKSTSKPTTNPTSKTSTIKSKSTNVESKSKSTKKITIPSKMKSTVSRKDSTLNSKISTAKTMSKPKTTGSTSKTTTNPTSKKSTITLPKLTKLTSKDEKRSTKKTTISSKTKSTLKSATKKSTGTTISSGPCDSKKCIAKSNHYCICGLPDSPTNSSVPSSGMCQDIGCADGGKYCYCNMFGKKGGVCQCFDYTPPCDQKKCKYDYDHQACYCFMGSAEPKKYQLPASKDCRDLLDQIGFGDGKNYCAMSVCNCDTFSQCTCNPPKRRVGKGTFNGFTPNPTTKCSIENCDKKASEYCNCNCVNLPKCQNEFVQMVNLTTTSKICDGRLPDYNCINEGQKCKCSNDGSCKCVNKVDPLIPINVPCDQCSSHSNKTCICNYRDLRIQLNSQAKQCSSLVKANKGDIPLDSCPNQVGHDCKCEYNTNYKQNACYCRNLDLFLNITSLVKRKDPNTKCARDDECSAYTDLYCVCSNSIDYSYVKKHTYQKSVPIETACKSLQAKNIVCTAVGYLSLCFGTRCALSPINLYNGTNDQNQEDVF